MKNKIIVLLSAMILMGGLCACGDSTPVNENNIEMSTQQSDEVEEQKGEMPEKTSELTDESYPEDLAYLYTENRFGYSIRLLTNYNTEEGYGFASYEGDLTFSEVIYITQYSGEVGDEEQLERIDMSKYEDSTDIFDLLIGNIDHELFGGMGFNLTGTDVEILETKEVNGVEMTKFEGTITAYQKDLKMEFTYPIVAYGIKSSKTPILVSCIDRTEDSSSHEIWVDKIDDVVSTFQDAE